jgi:calcineurin-like phosphoesterase family protein
MIYPFNDQTWIISDTHFFHENIGRYCARPDGWQDTIIENWNRLVQPEDVVFHVGDLALGKREKIEDLAPLLKGRLYLMRGNHDRRSNGFYQRLGITLVPDSYRMDPPLRMDADLLAPPYRAPGAGCAQPARSHPQ